MVLAMTVVTDMMHELQEIRVMQRVGVGTKDRAGKKRQSPHLGKLCFKAFDFILRVSASPIFPF